MLLAPFRTVTLAGLGAGVLSTVVFKKFGRPLIVGTLKLGYEAKDSTMGVFEDARRMATDVRDEARSEATESKAGSAKS